MIKSKKNPLPDSKIKFRSDASPATLTSSRHWIPCDEFCELYRLPRTRQARKKQPKYPSTRSTACRKCCERLSAKGLIITRKIDGHLYVSRESALTFGEMA